MKIIPVPMPTPVEPGAKSRPLTLRCERLDSYGCWTAPKGLFADYEIQEEGKRATYSCKYCLTVPEMDLLGWEDGREPSTSV